MKYRPFADTGWKISEVGLGCWGIGGSWTDVTNRTANKILSRSIDLGVNFYDTADVYGNGKSEKILGNFFKKIKYRKYIATKIGNKIKPHLPEKYNIQVFEKFIDQSLKNLNTQRIDLLQLHCPPKQLCGYYPMHEMMNYFKKKGKIKYYGFSVFNLDEAYAAINFKDVKSIQLVFNLFRQKPKKDFLKTAKSRNIAIIARGPLASGLLSGTIDKKTVFAPSDHRNYNISGKAFNIGDTFSGIPLEASIKAIKQLKKLLPNNYSLINLAINWILMSKEISVTIPGATNPLQVELCASSSGMRPINNLMNEIEDIYSELILPHIDPRW